MISASFLGLLSSFVKKLRHQRHSESLITQSSFLKRAAATLITIFIPRESFSRTNICIVSIPLTFEAKDCLVLNVILIIFGQHFIEFILRDLVLLTIG